MRFIIKILFIIAVFAGRPAFANTPEEKCMKSYKENPPKINITYNYGDLKFDNTKSVAELGEIYKTIFPGKGSSTIHGLTNLEPGVVTGVKTTVTFIDDERFCIYPEEINIKMSYNPTVYIANSLEPGSCRFNTTVRHEQTHLDLAHHALYVLADTLRDAEAEILASVSPIVTDADFDVDKITKQLTDAYHEKIKDYFDEYKKITEKYNGIIDSPENYMFETGLCFNK